MEKLLQPSKLNFDPNSSSAPKKWKHWLKTFENYVSFLIETESVKQKDCDMLKILFNHVPHQVYEHIDECQTYDEAVRILEILFNIKTSNKMLARHRLATVRQKPGQSLDDFIKILKKLTLDCNFTAVTGKEYGEEMMRDAFVNGINSQSIRQLLLQIPELSLKQAIEIATNFLEAPKNFEFIAADLCNNQIAKKEISPSETTSAKSIQHNKPTPDVRKPADSSNTQPTEPCQSADAENHSLSEISSSHLDTVSKDKKGTSLKTSFEHSSLSTESLHKKRTRQKSNDSQKLVPKESFRYSLLSGISDDVKRFSWASSESSNISSNSHRQNPHLPPGRHQSLDSNILLHECEGNEDISEKGTVDDEYRQLALRNHIRRTEIIVEQPHPESSNHKISGFERNKVIEETAEFRKILFQDHFCQDVEYEFHSKMVHSFLDKNCSSCLRNSGCTINFEQHTFNTTVNICLFYKYPKQISINEGIIITPEIYCIAAENVNPQKPFFISIDTCFMRSKNEQNIEVIIQHAKNNLDKWETLNTTKDALQQDTEVTISVQKFGRFRCLVPFSECENLAKKIISALYFVDDKSDKVDRNNNFIWYILDDLAFLQTHLKQDMPSGKAYQKVTSKKRKCQRYSSEISLRVFQEENEFVPQKKVLDKKTLWETVLCERFDFSLPVSDDEKNENIAFVVHDHSTLPLDNHVVHEWCDYVEQPEATSSRLKSNASRKKGKQPGYGTPKSTKKNSSLRGFLSKTLNRSKKPKPIDSRTL